MSPNLSSLDTTKPEEREGKMERGEKSNVSKEHMKSEGGGRERKERERIQRRKEKEEERG